MPPWLVYAMARLALFVAALAVLTLAGFRGPAALALAVVVSMLLAYVVLRPLRDRVAEQVATGMATRVGRIDRGLGRVGAQDAATEDAVLDAAAGGHRDDGVDPGERPGDTPPDGGEGGPAR